MFRRLTKAADRQIQHALEAGVQVETCIKNHYSNISFNLLHPLLMITWTEHLTEISALFQTTRIIVNCQSKSTDIYFPVDTTTILTTAATN